MNNCKFERFFVIMVGTTENVITYCPSHVVTFHFLLILRWWNRYATRTWNDRVTQRELNAKRIHAIEIQFFNLFCVSMSKNNSYFNGKCPKCQVLTIQCRIILIRFFRFIHLSKPSTLCYHFEMQMKRIHRNFCWIAIIISWTRYKLESFVAYFSTNWRFLNSFLVLPIKW